jgi:nitrogen-specific signal transduction histidine kinase
VKASREGQSQRETMGVSSADREGRRPEDQVAEEEHGLVFALCHEIGNLVGAVRLHAHLLDEDMGARDLALASVELDDLSARASALLSHIRPTLSGPPQRRSEVEPAALLGVVHKMMEEHGGRGTQLNIDVVPELPPVLADQDAIHPLLTSLIFCAMEAASARGSVTLRAERRPGGVAFLVEDDGPVDEDPTQWRDQMRRGRPLICAVASAILRKRDGALEVDRSDGRTCVALVLPVA